jgi:hypothetical protein
VKQDKVILVRIIRCGGRGPLKTDCEKVSNGGGPSYPSGMVMDEYVVYVRCSQRKTRYFEENSTLSYMHCLKIESGLLRRLVLSLRRK